MFKTTSLITKIILVAAVLAVILVALPAAGASAASLQDETNPPADRPVIRQRLERVWAREQAMYERQGNRLDRSDDFITKIQGLIDKANAKGWDTSAVQAALGAFQSVIPAAQSAHAAGADIIASHAGFDANGKVTDRAAAIETIKELQQVFKNSREALNGTGKALLQALRDFRQAHKPAAPTP